MPTIDDPGFAPAKVNLFLRVAGRRADGYHLLESFVVFPPIGDHLILSENEEGNGPTLSLSGPYGPALRLAGGGGQDDMVLRAAKLYAEEVGRTTDLAKLHFKLEKYLPVAAGLGGGSADAAAALRLLAVKWSETLGDRQLQALALRLGADVPMCLNSTPQLVSGIGEIFEPAPKLPSGIAILLANPGIEISTADIFDVLDPNEFRQSGALDGELAGIDDFAVFCQTIGKIGNDLAPVAIAKAPVVGELLVALNACPGARLAAMSGSGASCFALFGDLAAAKAAERSLVRKNPNYWCAVAALDGQNLKGQQTPSTKFKRC